MTDLCQSQQSYRIKNIVYIVSTFEIAVYTMLKNVKYKKALQRAK